MSDLYLTVLETASDPWALALISFLIAGTIVVMSAMVNDPRPPVVQTPRTPRKRESLLEPLPYEPEDFFDKMTRFHNEI